MNITTIFTSVVGWIKNLIELFTGLLALSVLVEVLFGSPIFGVSVVTNLINLIGSFGANGFAGLLELLILFGLYNKK